MDDRYNYYYHQGSGLWRTLRDGDFDESDVWDTIKDNRDSDNNTSDYGFPTFNEPKYQVSSKHVPSAAKMIPRASSSSSNPTPEPKKIYQKSAPLNVPNWSKLKRQKSKKISRNTRWQDDDDDDDDDEDGHDGDDDDEEEEDEYEDDGDGGYGLRLPPHEYIAMRLARSQISSFSVFEGAGRTLKGRDLSKMRNAVLTKTGFLESP